MEELIRDEDYSEEEAQRIILQNKLDKANEKTITKGEIKWEK